MTILMTLLRIEEKLAILTPEQEKSYFAFDRRVQLRLAKHFEKQAALNPVFAEDFKAIAMAHQLRGTEDTPKACQNAADDAEDQGFSHIRQAGERIDEASMNAVVAAQYAKRLVLHPVISAKRAVSAGTYIVGRTLNLF